MIGRVFNNRYQITERIGIGGMAEVYRAQDKVLGRVVAVKVMLPQYAADPEFTQRFRQEAASAANLQSPYIVNVYDWGQDGGTYYIVMEYVHGADLKTGIKKRGCIDQRKVAEIGAQVCQALSVAHNQDIMHRDIKPQNIMVQPDGNVKVMDFGIARAKNSVKSQTSSVLGTAHYISPEQAQGKELTPASDIYSLGIVMYEAVTGQLPFDGPDSVSVAMMQVNDAPMPPSSIKPDIDPGLEAIILHALEKEPYARFATAAEMKHCLNDYLAGRPVTIGGAETQVMGAAYASGAGSTSVMPAVSSNAVQTGRKVAAEDAETTRKRKKKRTIAIVVAVIAVIAIIAAFAFAMSGSNSKVTVPDVTGQTVEQATSSLQSSGLSVGTTTEVYSDTVSSGCVVSTDPKANASAEKDSKVKLTVSKGKDPAKDQVEVPDLSGMTADQASAALSKVGLVYAAGTAQYSDTVAANTVISQDQAAGTKIAKNSTVTVILSLGAQGVSVPNVVGKSESSATTTLKNSGFAVDVYYDSSSTVAQGNVISTDPVAGTELAKGDTVGITVSTGASTHRVQAYGTPSAGGSVSVSNGTVNDGKSVTITATPNSGYTVQSIVDDMTGTSYSGTTVTIDSVTRDYSFTVTFAQTTTGTSTSGGTSGSDTSTQSGGTGTGGQSNG